MRADHSPGRHQNCRQRHCGWWYLLPVIVLLTLTLAGFAQDVGGLRGYVNDADFRAGVSGAQVGVLEAGIATSTDENGRFSISGLPPGRYTVAVTREGYGRRLVYDVVVSPREIRDLDVDIIADVVELDEFVVSTEDLVSGNTQALLDVRQSLTTFVDSIGSEMIKMTGASDAGAALRRVAGTSVVDKKYVVIRGLSDRYNTVVLNGLRVPSSDPDKRAVNVDLFPGSLIAAIDNSKTFSPEMPGESTGGNVNIRLKSTPDKPFTTFSLKTGYNSKATENENFVMYRGPRTGLFGTQNERRLPAELASLTITKQGNPLVEGAARDRAARLVDRTTGVTTESPPMDFSFNLETGTRVDFFGNPLGLTAGFTYSKEYRFDPYNQSGRIPSNDDSFEAQKIFDQQVGTENLLSALFLNAGYEFHPDHRIRATLFANVAAEDLAIFGVRHPEGVPDDYFVDLKYRTEPGDDAGVREVLQYTERRLRTLQFSGEHNFDNLGSVEWGLAYSMSSQEQPDARYISFAGETAGGESLERIWRSLEDSDYNIRLDYKLPIFGAAEGRSEPTLGAKDQAVVLGLGMNYDYSDRIYRADNFAYVAPIEIPRPISPDDRVGFTAADLLATRDINDQAVYLFRNGAPEEYTVSQSVYAGYGKLDINLARNFQIGLGARVEITDLSVLRESIGLADPSDAVAAGFLTTNLETGEALPPNKIGRGSINETSVLPALNASWSFTENMKLKLSMSKTTARPSFKELGPVFTREPVSLSRFVGNPNLTTSSITNFDIRYEWYTRPGDLLAVSLFAKQIDDPIEFKDAGLLRYYSNAESALVYGLEFEFSQSLGLVSDELRDFSFNGNFAWMRSSVELSDYDSRIREIGGLPANRRLQAQPDYILNVGLVYDSKEWGLNAGVFLNVVGRLLWATGAAAGNNIFPDVYQEPVTSLDCVLSKKINDTWKITLRGQNLTDAEVLRVYDQTGRVYGRNRNGRTFSVAIGAEW